MTLPLPPITDADGRLDPAAVQFAFDVIARSFPLNFESLNTAIRNRLLEVPTRTRVYYGIVDTTSTTPVAGTGFTIAINGTGNVTLTWASAFASVPAVVATVFDTTNFRAAKHDSAATTTQANIECFATTAGTPQDNIFHFVAIGPA